MWTWKRPRQLVRALHVALGALERFEESLVFVARFLVEESLGVGRTKCLYGLFVDEPTFLRVARFISEAIKHLHKGRARESQNPESPHKKVNPVSPIIPVNENRELGFGFQRLS